MHYHIFPFAILMFAAGAIFDYPVGASTVAANPTKTAMTSSTSTQNASRHHAEPIDQTR